MNIYEEIVKLQREGRRGAVATVLIQKGTAKVGSPFVAGLGYGKIKAMLNDHGDRLQTAGPSTPIEVMGFSGELPQAGDTSFRVLVNGNVVATPATNNPRTSQRLAFIIPRLRSGREATAVAACHSPSPCVESRFQKPKWPEKPPTPARFRIPHRNTH